MPTMKSVRTAAPGTIKVAEIQRPAPGPMSEYLLIQNSVAGQSVAVFADDLPFEVATLNEPMIVYSTSRSAERTGPAWPIM